MLRHFLTIAVRNILKYFNYFILIYVTDELKYDRFHENYSQIYRMNRLYDSNDIHEDAIFDILLYGGLLTAPFWVWS